MSESLDKRLLNLVTLTPSIMPWAFILSVFSTCAMSAESSEQESFPPTQCMRQCELAGTCEQKAFNEFRNFDITLSTIVDNCQAKYLYAVTGACLDGKKLINTGTGFTSEIRFYSEDGEFQGLITQTDTAISPCMGQSYWPRYLQCEAPTVITKICGIGFDAGSPAFQNRWNE